MGGEGPINYLARSRYADDLSLVGIDREIFHQFLTAIDAEYLDWRSQLAV